MTSKTSKTQAQSKAQAEKPSPNGDGELGGLSWKELSARYPHAVKGTLQSETTGPYAGKRTVQVRCSASGCGTRRRVATSDLFQVSECREHVKAKRAARRAARRAEAKAEAS